jgi:glycosyltransferase involved in cell wall biosynthesis
MLAIRYYSSSVLAQSEFTKKQLKDIHNINNVIVCPHGFVPLQHQNYISDPLFNSKYIFYSGLNRPRKNLIGLLRAYRKFINQNSENKFDLVMSGPDFLAHGQSEIHDYIEKHSELKNRVHLLGFVDENTLSKLYKDASLLVMPSHLEGGYSYPALEALASGTPVLLNFYDMYGYNKGPGIYFFNQPNNPNFSNLTQALITLLNSNINKISPENHPLLNDFSWENVKTIINDVYSSRC